MKYLVFSLMVFFIFLSVGCASFGVAKVSQNQINSERRAIHMEARNNEVFVAVDLFNLDVLTYRPYWQVGAAVLDAAAGYWVYNKLTKDDSGDSGNIVINGGERNTFNVSAHNITTTTTVSNQRTDQTQSFNQ